ncbi:undecaprenyldiphospho-muramoylpentapeptide beta-N-acetylglucosaminyltransferase [bacterium]|jgi:UDP-N-acetylglucosamine--N-acetylmuramyl-(pentapeptide) pyrophosphoryl-undecaprenol N-acetylglucosamine transferase|nr:undecaprenyldiphospho-muramoylpentapeptide beta-N-acetylglucosaminyltransferase [bacterium]MDP6659585.1 undecaprenyldiphospho-muramoylpentapeptide beta-N-acetylglucosaminyltransferase [Candidatus Paceibacterota bacterium]|tara:strand:- start:18104 stop:19237 length:1134 start_codon:yes stop_codon:yes gene_type:complete
MKIVFTGGGSGGHFYPIIAVAQSVRDVIAEKKLLKPELYYIGPKPFDERALFENDIEFRKSAAGKIRRYFSIKNIFDSIKTTWGVIKAVFQIYSIYPDVVFSKGGYASFPTVLATKLFRIPLIIHESDAAAGRVNKWAGKFANKVAVSYPETAEDFPEEKVAYTGNPIRKDLFNLQREGAREYLNLETTVPVILIMGGSQGSQAINDKVLDALPELVKDYQIIHQVGEKNIKEIEGVAKVVLDGNQNITRYHPFGTLDTLALRMSAGAASLIVSRAGSGALFEIAAWGVPSIIIPIPEDVSHDQQKNAFSFAKAGACVVVHQKNLTAHLLVSEINRLMNDEGERAKMGEAAKTFSKPDAAKVLAEAIMETALEHESS